nr:histone H1B-like [Pogona vitticeps]
MVRGKRSQGNPEAAEASTAAALEPAKKGKNRSSGSLSQLILQAFETGLPRKGLTLAALKKSLTEAGFNVNKNNSRLKRELRTLVSNGLLVRVTGSGVSGTFKRGRGRAARKPTKSEKRKARKATAAQRASAKNHKPKKPRKKQPAVTKPKGLQNRASAAVSDRKRQYNKHQAAKKPG